MAKFTLHKDGGASYQPLNDGGMMHEETANWMENKSARLIALALLRSGVSERLEGYLANFAQKAK